METFNWQIVLLVGSAFCLGMLVAVELDAEKRSVMRQVGIVAWLIATLAFALQLT